MAQNSDSAELGLISTKTTQKLSKYKKQTELKTEPRTENAAAKIDSVNHGCDSAQRNEITTQQELS